MNALARASKLRRALPKLTTWQRYNREHLRVDPVLDTRSFPAHLTNYLDIFLSTPTSIKEPAFRYAWFPTAMKRNNNQNGGSDAGNCWSSHAYIWTTPGA